MLALDLTSRAALAGAALLAYAGAFSTAPTTASVDTVARAAVSTAKAPQAVRLIVVVPHRDPFAGGMPTAVHIVMAPIATPPPFPAIPPSLGPLPPNAGARGAPFPFSPAEHVSAVVTGARPFALIDGGSTTQLVTVGDRYEGERIVAIDTGGVHLQSGVTLPVAQRSSFTPSNAETDNREILPHRAPRSDRPRVAGPGA
jgi:hypothetical protein